MKNLITIFAVLFIGFIVILMAVRTNKQDKADNLKWATCEIKYEASGIPFEGRASFMQECFEGKDITN